jgi:hypothetical protein
MLACGCADPASFQARRHTIFPNLRVASLADEGELLELARSEAFEIIARHQCGSVPNPSRNRCLDSCCSPRRFEGEWLEDFQEWAAIPSGKRYYPAHHYCAGIVQTCQPRIRPPGT